MHVPILGEGGLLGWGEKFGIFLGGGGGGTVGGWGGGGVLLILCGSWVFSVLTYLFLFFL